MSAEKNKAVIYHWAEAYNAQDWESFWGLYDPAANFPNTLAFGLPPTLDNFRLMMAAWEKSFPDLQTEVNEIVAEGDKVMIRETITGTHQAEWNNIPATGKTVKMDGMVVFKLKQGKIIEHRFLVDIFGLLQQLGVLPG